MNDMSGMNETNEMSGMKFRLSDDQRALVGRHLLPYRRQRVKQHQNQQRSKLHPRLAARRNRAAA